MSTMNKNDLASQVAEETGLETGQAKLALEKTLEVIVRRVAAGDEVNLTGFGKFSVTERQARHGRNPATGEAMEIAASRTVKFSPAKATNDTANA
jgi:DNA-binding protein HU-beta